MSQAVRSDAVHYFTKLRFRKIAFLKLFVGCTVILCFCFYLGFTSSATSMSTTWLYQRGISHRVITKKRGFSSEYIDEKCVSLNDPHASTPSERVDLRIIVLTFSRVQSLVRLLQSLNIAFYGNSSVLLDVWIDRSTDGRVDEETVDAARTFRFGHGTKRVCVHPRHVGILGQWLTPWKPSTRDSQEIAVILEDDLTVSPHIFTYLKLVHRKYGHMHNVNGFALQGEVMKLASGSSGYVDVSDEHKVFMFPTLGTWGYSPRAWTWALFRHWFQYVYKNADFQPIVPGHMSSDWYRTFKKSGTEDSIWEIWYIYFSWINQEYTLYPNFKGHRALTFNWREDGLHYKNSREQDSQADRHKLLLDWRPEYEDLPEVPVKLDLNGNIVPHVFK